jgi:hypothetical protein
MFKKLATLTLVVGLMSAFTSRGMAQNLVDSDTRLEQPSDASRSRSQRVADNDKLRRDVAGLVSDTKAGKVKLSDSTAQSTSKHHLSKTAKIAIGVGIAVGVLALIAIHVRKHMFDDFTLSNIAIR